MNDLPRSRGGLAATRMARCDATSVAVPGATYRSIQLAGAALVVAAAFVLGGCATLTRTSPLRETFLLEPTAPPVVAHTQPDTLVVDRIRVAAPFRGKAFVYRMGDLRFQTDYYVEFLVSPEAMLTDETARSLEHARVYARVASPGSGADADWRLDGFASALYADARDPAKPWAELTITYYLAPTRGSVRTPVWSHEYRQRVAMRDATPAAYADALNVAFGEIVTALARDLAGAHLPAR